MPAAAYYVGGKRYPDYLGVKRAQWFLKSDVKAHGSPWGSFEMGD